MIPSPDSREKPVKHPLLISGNTAWFPIYKPLKPQSSKISFASSSFLSGESKIDWIINSLQSSGDILVILSIMLKKIFSYQMN